jgi:poly-gamma-glutamate synthesis protein (capsule biosynthesis protein)
VSTRQTSGLRQLSDYANRLQEARTSRRALLKAGVAAGVAVTAPTIATAAPGAPSGDVPLTLAQGLAPGTALVVSPRLALPGIGSDQIAPLLQGDYTSWHEVGVPLMMPIKLFAIEPDYIPEGTSPERVSDYNTLAQKLDETPGGFAMLPIEMIDPRVSVLDIDGVNPLLASATNEEPVVKIGVAGDIIFGRNGGNRQATYVDYNLPMYQVKDFLSTFDVTVSNFECFVSETIDLSTVDPLDFVTIPDSLQGMVMGGIDSVTMANNHAVFSYGGYGIPGMQDTMKHLNEAGIVPWGVGMDLDEARAPWVTEVNGVSIAFYGVDGVTANLEYPTAMGVQPPDDATPVDARSDRGGTNPLKLDQNLADIERLAGEHDIVLPYFHMGDQYVWTPRDWVVDTCRKCIDAGATAVLTAHPHANMGMEIYKGKAIYYSIGNFIYDQMFTVETRQGYFLDLTFRGKNLVNYRIHPSEVLDFVQPRFQSSREKASFWDRHWRSVDLIRAAYDYTPNP